jgi:glycosyltransferase involved in cell wall biosynthesis
MPNAVSEAPKVTVLMPVYRNEQYLKKAIESILNQTFKDFEFLIICDDPSDNIRTILDHFQSHDERIKAFYFQERQGLVSALNKGCGLAKGKYIARMDADDISLPKRFSRQVAFLDEHPDVGVVGSWARLCSNNKDAGIRKVPGEHNFIKWCLCFYCPMIHPSVMLRKETLIRSGGYSDEMIHAEDYDLWRRLCIVANIANIQEVLIHLRLHEASVSSSYRAEQRKNSIRISQLMISDVLGKKIPIDLIKTLWNTGYISYDDALLSARLILSIYQDILPDIPKEERKKISNDAALRLCNLAYGCGLNYRVSRIISIAIKLDPLVLGKFLMISARYKIQKHFRHGMT